MISCRGVGFGTRLRVLRNASRGSRRCMYTIEAGSGAPCLGAGGG